VSAPLRVGIVGCGLMGRKRAAALGPDRAVAVCDADPERARALAAQAGAEAVPDADAVLERSPDVVIVATSHDALADAACRALAAGAHVLVEKPAGRTPEEADRIAAAANAAGRLVKVGFNHRFHPGIMRAVTETRAGLHGEPMYLRARYGHGGRPGYDREWRADPAVSGGGELLDQGMHVLDLSRWLLGPLPLHSSLLRTAYWDMPVEDNAVVTLAESGGAGPWSSFHVSWSEWKNEFALDIYTRHTKLAISGLTGSYGPQTLRIWRMRPEMGPPDLEEVAYPAEDRSWADEWEHLRAAIHDGPPEGGLLGDLESARYGLAVAQEAFRANGFPVAQPAAVGGR
jgi:predicted dehydrogenase